MGKKKKKGSGGISKAILFELYGIILFTLSLLAIAGLGAVGRSLWYLSRFFLAVGAFFFLWEGWSWLCG